MAIQGCFRSVRLQDIEFVLNELGKMNDHHAPVAHRGGHCEEAVLPATHNRLRRLWPLWICLSLLWRIAFVALEQSGDAKRLRLVIFLEVIPAKRALVRWMKQVGLNDPVAQ